MRTALSLSILVFCAVTVATADSEAIDRFHQLVLGGSDEEAMTLLCELPRPPVPCGTSDSSSFAADASALWLRRYESTFTPPANAESLLFDGWRAFGPIGGAYNRNGVASMQGDAESNTVYYFPWDGTVEQLHASRENPPDSNYLIAFKEADPMFTVDLDLDGVVDVSFGAKGPVIGEGFQVLTDDAGDGMRF